MVNIISFIYLVLLVILVIRGLILNLRIPKTFMKLNTIYESLRDKDSFGTRIPIYILIPLLREQSLLPQILEIFSQIEGNPKVILITTEKENDAHRNGIKSTKAFAEELLRSHEGSDNFEIFHYPEQKGVMAHQLNYALEKLNVRHPDGNFYIAVYNADSVVDKDYVTLAETLIPQNKVIQQSAVFMSNYLNKSESLKEAFLKGNALLQTRWTVVHELNRLFRQSSKQRLSSLEVAHVVGHGLLIDASVINSVGGFPTQFINEDLPLGFLLRLQGHNIVVYPKLELAESPRTVNAVFTQYRTWFYGALHSPQYLYFYIKQNRSIDLNLLRAIYWSTLTFVRSQMWLSLSFVWMFILCYPIVRREPIFVLTSLIAFINYTVLSWILVVKYINRNPHLITGGKQIELSIYDLFSAFPVYLTHSYGPVLAILDSLKSLLFNSPINKRKTER